MFAWESSFFSAIEKTRTLEITSIRNYRISQVTNIAMGRASPALSSLVALVTYSMLGNQLTVADAFATVSVFQALRLALIMVPLSMQSLTAVHAAAKRVDQYLLLAEDTLPVRLEKGGEVVLEMRDVTLGYTPVAQEEKQGEDVEKDPQQMGFSLKGVNLTIRKGEIVAVCGAVGKMGNGT